ncbi:uncharacterized protein LOC113524462 isoform X2 [Pangasianodon hypophthalmus]|uniref:uncharacterized protein LOC113524462 isoform X2 n=1 Tax=Pangasianodon hypophthalmus TaxID=310915 RepID=UPI002306EE60|nr:uncharacterized protein LOC113524462 isoform X2 [Pangasianodon hypophthalmus]
MAKVLHALTVLIIAFSIFQESTVVMTAVTQVTRQANTETHHPSSTASLSTHSTFATHSPSKVTQDLNETQQTNNSISPETSTHLTATTSQSHTLSHGEITTTDQTKTAVVVSDSSGTTALRTTKLASVTTILSSTEESGKTATSTGKVNMTPSSASSNKGEDSLAKNPGLVAILCIFFIILALVIVVAIAKIISCRKSPQFERLEDLPMNKMNEDAPFARYPPK